jgi:hypothetical protein
LLGKYLDLCTYVFKYVCQDCNINSGKVGAIFPEGKGRQQGALELQKGRVQKPKQNRRHSGDASNGRKPSSTGTPGTTKSLKRTEKPATSGDNSNSRTHKAAGPLEK